MKARRQQPKPPAFVGPHDIRCIACGERRDPPIWRVCQSCTLEGLRKMAATIQPDYTPTTEADVYLYPRELEIIERYQGDHANHDAMFDIVHPIAEADKRKHGLA